MCVYECELLVCVMRNGNNFFKNIYHHGTWYNVLNAKRDRGKNEQRKKRARKRPNNDDKGKMVDFWFILSRRLSHKIYIQFFFFPAYIFFFCASFFIPSYTLRHIFSVVSAVCLKIQAFKASLDFS